MSEIKHPFEVMQIRIIRLMRLSVVPVAVWEVYRLNFNGVLIAFGALFFMYSPDLLQRWYKFRLPLEYAFFMVLFTFATMILGEFGGAYERFWWWDAGLHVFSAMVFSFWGFLLLYIAKLQGKLDISPNVFAFLAFSVGMMVGGVWEIFEFGMDNVFGFNMQKSGLSDTMGDLIVDAIGSLITALGSRQFLINGGEGILGGRFVAWAVDRFVRANPKLPHGDGL